MNSERKEAINDMIRRYEELEESLAKMKAISNGSPLCEAVIAFEEERMLKLKTMIVMTIGILESEEMKDEQEGSA